MTTPTTPQDPWADYVPPRINTTGQAPTQERMPLFYLETGEGEVEHTAPRRISAPAAIRAIQTIAQRGPEAGTWQMLEDSLEPDTLKVLTECEHVEYEVAQRMLQQLGRLYYGQAMELGGK